jgi:hypothetical protein
MIWMRIITRKEPKVYPVKLPDCPHDGEMASGFAIEIEDTEITIERRETAP